MADVAHQGACNASGDRDIGQFGKFNRLSGIARCLIERGVAEDGRDALQVEGPRAEKEAMTSSWPGSQSMMAGIVMMPRGLAQALTIEIEEAGAIDVDTDGDVWIPLSLPAPIRNGVAGVGALVIDVDVGVLGIEECRIDDVGESGGVMDREPDAPESLREGQIKRGDLRDVIGPGIVEALQLRRDTPGSSPFYASRPVRPS